MQKIVCRSAFLILFVFICSSTALGTQLGPATPSADHGEVNMGIGYYYHEADLEGVEIEQDRIYLHLGYGLGIGNEPRWETYIRAGGADLEASDFDGEYAPFAMLGLKGAIYEGPVFGWGMVVQGGYFLEFEDDDTDVEFEDYWEIEGGFPFQAALGPVLVYAGPVFFHAEASVENNMGSTELDEENNVGAFGGLRFSFGDVSIEAEAQYKSEFSAGGLITVSF